MSGVTMNFNEFYKQACLVYPEDSIKVVIEHWRHFNLNINDQSLNKKRWQLFSIKLGKHFEASTPLEVLNLYKEAINGL